MNAGDNVRNMTEFTHLVDNIFMWGKQRGITVENGATGLSQIKKLQEELDELREGLETREVPAIQDAIGDMFVVLQQIARLEGIPMYYCLAAAWDDIKDRQGQMRFGIFFKQADIDLVGYEGFRKAESAEQLLDWIAQAKADSTSEEN